MVNYPKNLGVTGIPLAFISPSKYYSANLCLNSELKGPQYEIKAQERQTSPTSLFFFSLISLDPIPHLSFSPVNDWIRDLAVLIFF